jgi:hypothetical protein
MAEAIAKKKKSKDADKVDAKKSTKKKEKEGRSSSPKKDRKEKENKANEQTVQASTDFEAGIIFNRLFKH